jgi:hypothetical protein
MLIKCLQDAGYQIQKIENKQTKVKKLLYSAIP